MRGLAARLVALALALLAVVEGAGSVGRELPEARRLLASAPTRAEPRAALLGAVGPLAPLLQDVLARVPERAQVSYVLERSQVAVLAIYHLQALTYPRRYRPVDDLGPGWLPPAPPPGDEAWLLDVAVEPASPGALDPAAWERVASGHGYVLWRLR